jgi:hypothetical protein
MNLCHFPASTDLSDFPREAILNKSILYTVKTLFTSAPSFSTLGMI